MGNPLTSALDPLVRDTIDLITEATLSQMINGILRGEMTIREMATVIIRKEILCQKRVKVVLRTARVDCLIRAVTMVKTEARMLGILNGIKE